VFGGFVGYQLGEYDDRNKKDLLVLMQDMDKFGSVPEENHDHE
jgi:hypothetical protein